MESRLIKCKCLNCGKEFERKIYNLVRYKTVFCCQKCYLEHKTAYAKKKEVKCATCGKTFKVPIGKEGVFHCCRDCYFQYRRNNSTGGVETECPTCHKKFVTDQCRLKKGKVFCCRECFRQYLLSEKNPLRNRKKMVCLNCGKVKEKMGYEETKFCSRKCCTEHFKKNGHYERIAESQKTGEYRKCKYCGEEYWVHEYRKETTSFCSMECFDNYRREVVKCPTCGKEKVYPKWEKRKYCSSSCAAKGYIKRKSKFFVEVYKYLEKISDFNLEPEKYFRFENRGIFIDILINSKIAIECNGDYWHCNPIVYSPEYYHAKIRKTAKQIWESDDYRNNLLRKNGYPVIVLWEKDWNEDKDFFKKLKEKIDEICKS